jgi:hypothetical protein
VPENELSAKEDIVSEVSFLERDVGRFTDEQRDLLPLARLLITQEAHAKARAMTTATTKLSAAESQTQFLSQLTELLTEQATEQSLLARAGQLLAAADALRNQVAKMSAAKDGPAPAEAINLIALADLQSEFGLYLGYVATVLEVMSHAQASGTFKGDITVSKGQTCIFVSGGVTGNLTETGGSVGLSNATVGGNFQVNGGGTFSTGPSTVIHGSVQIQNIPLGPAQNQVCATNVGNDLQFQQNGTAVQIGSSSQSCPGNVIGGNLVVQNNTAATVIFGNSVTGNLQDQNNTALTQVFSNTVKNYLQCQNNRSITGGGTPPSRSRASARVSSVTKGAPRQGAQASAAWLRTTHRNSAVSR